MSFWKNVAAAAAGVAVYKLVDYGLRRLEPDVLQHDVPSREELPNRQKDAIMSVASRLDTIPTVKERNLIARAINLTAGIAATAIALELRQRLLAGVVEHDPEPDLVRTFLTSAAIFVTMDVILKPAMGLGSPTGRTRRFLSQMASREARQRVRALLA